MKNLFKFLSSLEGNATAEEYCEGKESIYFLLQVLVILLFFGACLFILLLSI